ncbi:3813_t:CDS:1, partial [Racocetra persica]
YRKSFEQFTLTKSLVINQTAKAISLSRKKDAVTKEYIKELQCLL